MQKPTLSTLLLILLFGISPTFGQIQQLRKQLEQIAVAYDGKLGIAIKDLSGKDTVSLNGQGHFAMQSVYKFHLALAVLQQVDKGKFKLEQKILVKKKDLLPNTHSPLRDKYPNGEIEIPLSEILKYTVSLSDNNGCDILFRLLGGPKVVDTYLKNIGIKNVAVVATEEEMHQDEKIQFTNWSTPWSATQLLEKFYQKKLLSPSSHEFLWKTLVETSTGANKLKGLLPAGTVVGHKTGYSGSNSQGIIAATNDIGIVQLPNGKHYAVAVFYGGTKLNMNDSDRVIAEVSKAAWDYFLGK